MKNALLLVALTMTVTPSYSDACSNDEFPNFSVDLFTVSPNLTLMSIGTLSPPPMLTDYGIRHNHVLPPTVPGGSAKVSSVAINLTLLNYTPLTLVKRVWRWDYDDG